MRQVVRRWDPWRQLEQLQGEMNRLVAQNGWLEPFTSRGYPAVNLWQNGDALVLTAELPGLAPDALDITVVRDTVTLRGERPAETLQAGESYYRQERRSQPFSRSVQLPFEVDADKTEAVYEHGVLKLKLQRPEEHKPKKIAVKAR